MKGEYKRCIRCRRVWHWTQMLVARDASGDQHIGAYCLPCNRVQQAMWRERRTRLIRFKRWA